MRTSGRITSAKGYKIFVTSDKWHSVDSQYFSNPSLPQRSYNTLSLAFNGQHVWKQVLLLAEEQ